MAAEMFRFGEFELDGARQQLRRGGEPVEIHARPLRLLLYLIEHRDRVVPRQELFELLWPGTAVSDAALSTAVYEARRALGDEGSEQRWIETAKGVGFRFAGEAERRDAASPVEPGAPPRVAHRTPDRRRTWATAALALVLLGLGLAAWVLRTAPPPTATSLLVLPFEDLSPGGDHAYLARGMSEELIDRLTRVKGLEVKGRTSGEFARKMAERLGWDVPEIGRQAGVARIVEGSVRRSEDRIRVSVQVLDSSDGFHLWSNTYDRPFAEIFAVQEEIARAVSDALRVQLTNAPRRASDPRAWELHWLASRILHRAGEAAARDAIERYERALAIDPEFAPAHGGLANARLELCKRNYQTCREQLPRARAAARRALALDDQLAWTHTVLGDLLAREYDWTASEAEHRRALELTGTPSLYHGYLLIALGRVAEGFELIDRATEGGLLNPAANVGAGGIRVVMGVDLERALEYAERAEVLEPELHEPRFLRTYANRQLGREQAALDALLAAPFPPEVRQAILAAHAARGWAGVAPIVLAHAVRITGRECGYALHWGAVWRMRAGDVDGALDCLERGHRERSLDPVFALKHAPMWDGLRDQPRFRAMLEEMGLAG